MSVFVVEPGRRGHRHLGADLTAVLVHEGGQGGQELVAVHLPQQSAQGGGRVLVPGQVDPAASVDGHQALVDEVDHEGVPAETAVDPPSLGIKVVGEVAGVEPCGQRGPGR